MSGVSQNETDSISTLSSEMATNLQEPPTESQDVSCKISQTDHRPGKVENTSAEPTSGSVEQVTAHEDVSQLENSESLRENEILTTADQSIEKMSKLKSSENSSNPQIIIPDIASSLGENEDEVRTKKEQLESSEKEVMDFYVNKAESAVNQEAVVNDKINEKKEMEMPPVGIKETTQESQEENSTPEEVVMHQELIEESTAPKASIEDCTALVDEAVSEISPPKSPPSRTEQRTEPHSLHHIKTVQFKDRKVNIVTQNENGPCPLVAIINTLLLHRKISFPSGGHQEIVSAAKLMEYLGNAILENIPKNADPEMQLNFEQNMNDAMAVLPKLQTGLDVNVKFTGVHDFEYTTECIIFDLLNVRLYHGWLFDPQDAEIVAAVGQAGYNQLVEKVIDYKCSNDTQKMTEALIIESFLERSASQLTYHGLVELARAMNDGEVAVLFRNNHFSTILKHQNVVLQLVTDQGFLNEPSVVWETLDSIDGDGQFVDGFFRPVPPKPEHKLTQGEANACNLSTEQQIDQDFLVALSLQEEQPADVIAAADFTEPMSQEEKTAQEARDAELARQLQNEEQQAAEAERGTIVPDQPEDAGSSGPRSSSQSSQSKKKDNCTIL